MEENEGGSSYRFHRRVSLSWLLKTPEGCRWSDRKGRTIEGEATAQAIGEKRRKKDKIETRIEAIMGQGTRVKYRRTGKLLPDVRFHPLSQLVKIRCHVISILSTAAARSSVKIHRFDRYIS